MQIFERVNNIVIRVESFFVGQYLKSNQEVAFFFCLIVFPILTRVTPLWLISLSFVTVFILYICNHFYNFVNKIAAHENKNVNLQEYSWGFVKEPNKNLDFPNFVAYLKNKKWDFYRQFFDENKNMLVLLTFLFGDLVVAFKNLSVEISGVYFAMSLFTKFVFIAYLFVSRATTEINRLELSKDRKEILILDNFYKHFSGISSLSLVLFLLFFALGRFLTEIFFGFKYFGYQTSLSFILLANLALLLGLIIFKTAQEIDATRTWQLTKISAPIIILLFVFLNITHPDTVSFFIIGTVSVFSIFLYNFCIRKPAYIESTYNHLF